MFGLGQFITQQQDTCPKHQDVTDVMHNRGLSESYDVAVAV